MWNKQSTLCLTQKLPQQTNRHSVYLTAPVFLDWEIIFMKNKQRFITIFFPMIKKKEFGSCVNLVKRCDYLRATLDIRFGSIMWKERIILLTCQWTSIFLLFLCEDIHSGNKVNKKTFLISYVVTIYILWDSNIVLHLTPAYNN